MSEIKYTRYAFRSCVGGFFQMPTTDARRLIPSHLQPIEVQHERSVLAITAFQFTDSEVGPYNEVVLAVIVPPMVEAGRPLPKAGFFPFMVGTSTEASRTHAIERWHLPHYMEDASIDFTESERLMVVNVKDGDRPVLDLEVTKHDFAPIRNLYNVFTIDGGGHYRANIYMDAPHSEHEEEGGLVTLHEHPMTNGLTLDEIDVYPFREEWYGEGVQTFEPLVTI
jgi:Acetoacetate decarboxylase (ADC)